MQVYRAQLRSFLLSTLVLSLASVAIFLVSLGIGPAGFSLRWLLEVVSGGAPREVRVVLSLRLVRAAVSYATGAILGLSGALMQGVTRNPLADPFILGLSSSALAVVSVALVVQPGLIAARYYLAVLAFAGALLGYTLTVALSRLAGGGSASLVLSGIAVSAFFSGVSHVLLYAVQRATGMPYILLLAGSASAALARDIPYLLASAAVCLAVSLAISKGLNAYLYGDEYSQQLGFNPKLLSLAASATASLGTGVTIAITGIVGFVGLASPHISRFLVGSDHRFLLPTSFLVGGVVTLVADVVVRLLSMGSPYGELPLGTITSSIGGPFIAYVLLRWLRK